MSERFQVIKELGRGGVASVHKAWDTRLNRHVAIKTVLSEAEISADLVREATMTAGLDHPHIVSVFDVGLGQKGALWIVMEFLNGETLDTIIEKGPLSVDEFLQISQQVLEGLQAAHRKGIMHGDIKPSNIMTHFLSDSTLQVKLLDFGLARLAHQPIMSEVGEDGAVCGSVHFMAPEQLRGSVLDARSDLYSFGCVCYAMLSGQVPYNGHTMKVIIQQHLTEPPRPLKQIRPDLPDFICDWVHWLIEKDADKRPPDSTAAFVALRHFIQGDYTTLKELLRDTSTNRSALVKPTTKVIGLPLSSTSIDRGYIKKNVLTPSVWPYAASLFALSLAVFGGIMWFKHTKHHHHAQASPSMNATDHASLTSTQTPKIPITAVLKTTTPPVGFYGEWGTYVRMQDKKLHLAEKDMKGGLVYHKKVSLAGKEKFSPGFKLTIGPKNTAKRLRVALRSDVTSLAIWRVSLEEAKVGEPTYVWTSNDYPLSNPNSYFGETEKIELDKIYEVQIAGDFETNVEYDLTIEEIIAAP